EKTAGGGSQAYPQGRSSDPPEEQKFKVDYLNGAATPAHAEALPGVFNRGVNGYGFQLQKLAEYGVPDLPVWITETGWRHYEASLQSRNDAEGAKLSADEAAEMMRRALYGPGDGFTPWLEDPRVHAVVFFGFDGDPERWGHSSWVDVDARGSVVGKYAPFSALRSPKEPSP